MEKQLFKCPNCDISIGISNLPDNQEEWNSLQFTCSNCNHRIGLINTIQDSKTSTMKKVIFKENCSFCNIENTIVTAEGSEGKSIKNKCFNCKKMMFLTVPNTKKDLNENTANDDSNETFTKRPGTITKSVNPVRQILTIEIPASPTNTKQIFDIHQDYMTIGRKNQTESQPDIEIETTDGYMSRVHATIKYHEKKNAYSIINKSTNKTFINEQIIEDAEEVILKNGDIIRMGRTKTFIKLN